MLICRDHDNAIRWQEGERLDHLFEKTCDDAGKTNSGADAAVITDDATISFRELDNRANQTARYLRKQGIKPGDRVGLLVNKSLHTYVALLAVLKLNAAFVPLDASFPQDRIAYIAKDAGVDTIVTLSTYRDHLSEVGARLILLDEVGAGIDAENTERLSVEEKGSSADQLCYIIYTSGSTGHPKGVAIEHPSICNFVAVAAEVYGIRKDDRVFQGMTIAFDFSVEELWVPLIAGAALVPGRPDTNLLGSDLADYLIERDVTALCCVPTLLATIEEELPKLRFLLVSGEACPRDLVSRWHRPGRIFLNAYGPTEASVTATITEVHPDKAVTIGGPLPTYTIVILDADEDKAVEDGGMGEICIAGIALAKGYLNRDDLTEKAFIHDFLDIHNNPPGKIYRTGDLGRINDDGEVEFHGRIDLQVKVRGYRIELTEIESVFMEAPQVALAVVDTYEIEPGVRELVAYYTLKEGESELPRDALSELLRSRLPAYMIPSYVEELVDIPMLPSQKADRKKLPAPAGPRFVAASGEIIAPRNETEQVIAEALAEILGIEQVSVEDDFFNDLGAHSLLMAQLSAALRDSLPDVALSMRDIYLKPTVAKLAELISTQEKTHSVKAERDEVHVASTLEYVVCGALQMAYYASYASLVIGALLFGLMWVFSADQAADAYVRAVGFGGASFAVFAALPIVLKWLVIGRWTERAIPVWSLQYFRFWMIKHLVQTSPMNLFKGSPLLNLHLRLLGARIGKNAVIKSKLTPVCTDLIEIGDDAVLSNDSMILGYTAIAGRIHTGTVSVGSNAFVGDGSVLDINTVIGDDGQLGHSSSLQSGQEIPAGKRFHGSPAVETESNYSAVEPLPGTSLRRLIYSTVQIAGTALVALPAPLMLLYAIWQLVLGVSVGSAADVIGVLPPTGTTFAGLALASLVLFVGGFALSLLIIALLPRLLNSLIKEDRLYPLYGFHYYVQGLISAMSNSKYFNGLFGDSSYIMFFLQMIGYRLSRVGQTGSNFGNDQKHDNPYLCKVGKGTMVSDGLSMMNVEMSSTSFKVGAVSIGEDSFVGTNVHYPASGKTGANCLMAAKVLVPIDGPMRENVGLLGSPSFEIPRSVERDTKFDGAEGEALLRQNLRAKNTHNLFTIASMMCLHWAYGCATILLAYLAIWQIALHGAVVLPLVVPVFAIFTVAYFALMAQWGWGRAELEPRICSIYDKHYWQVEHYWKRNETPLITWFKGTPFKNVLSRLLGIKVGAKVFDDGCYVSEKTMLTIGDNCTLNAAVVVQCHSLEDGVFKSDFVRIGNGCTIGGNAFVQYGATMGDNAVLAPDSFLMKGEVVHPNTTWQGNPAREI